MDEGLRSVCIGVSLLILVVAVVIWVISTGVRSGLAKREEDVLRRSQSPRPSTPADRTRGFPVQAAAHGEHWFTVEGVSKETAEDVSIQVSAATAANAKVKAELQGVVVTEVREIVG
jgi:nitrogen fixation-related uncharacterized protein